MVSKYHKLLLRGSASGLSAGEALSTLINVNHYSCNHKAD